MLTQWLEDAASPERLAVVRRCGEDAAAIARVVYREHLAQTIVHRTYSWPSVACSYQINDHLVGARTDIPIRPPGTPDEYIVGLVMLALPGNIAYRTRAGMDIAKLAESGYIHAVWYALDAGGSALEKWYEAQPEVDDRPPGKLHALGLEVFLAAVETALSGPTSPG